MIRQKRCVVRLAKSLYGQGLRMALVFREGGRYAALGMIRDAVVFSRLELDTLLLPE